MKAVAGLLASATSLQWQINGLRIAGLGWGDPTGRPLLALHGWLDNAASFARLAPLLAGRHVVALDLTGHGRSDRRSADASYQIWDDLPEIRGVIDALGWDSFDLVGHSRGAIIAALLAAIHPERVAHLVLLDAVFPEPVAPVEFPAQLRRALEDKIRLLQHQPRKYVTQDEAIAARQRRGLDPEATWLLAQRSLCAGDGGLSWITDPRLRGASPVKMSKEQIEAVLRSLTMPVLLVIAAEAAEQWAPALELVRRHVPAVVIDRFAGGHHFHMGGSAGPLARSILAFTTGGETAS